MAATLAGSPCDIFSEARWWPLVAADGAELRGHRPLRTSAGPRGLDGLSLQEMRQLCQGSAFALQSSLEADGKFCTEEMKMYSPALSAAFAQGVFDGLSKMVSHGLAEEVSLPSDLAVWARSIQEMCAAIDP